MTTAQQETNSAALRDLAPAELQQRARDYVRGRIRKGEAPTGEEVGERFGMKERWGRIQISAVRDEAARGALRPVPRPNTGTPGTTGTAPARGGMPPGTEAVPGVPAPVRVAITDPQADRPTVSLTRPPRTGTDSGTATGMPRHESGTSGMPVTLGRHAAPPSGTDTAADGTTARRQRWSNWPLLVIGLGAFVAIWGGWVGLGELTGFGPIELLPGIVDGWVVNTAITLPLGMEAYAAFALKVWLAPSPGMSTTARRFAQWSALGALALGAAGQIAYHLMVAEGMKVAPWQITAFVSCLPVAVLGLGAALAHLIHQPAKEAS
jgi:hypothetical protein